MKKTIKWFKWKNPLINVNEDGEEDVNSRVILRQTPLGIETLKLHPDTNNQIDYVIGHTNFDIDESVKNIIEDTPGVEILTVFTPYQFRIAIGKAFDRRHVKRTITAKLCKSPPKQVFLTTDIEANIRRDVFILETASEPWLLYVLPNGQYESFTSKDVVEFENKLAQYEQAKGTIGGMLLTHAGY